MSPNEAGEQLDLLVAAIHQAWSDIAPVADPRVHSALGRRLLEQLRAEIVEDWPGMGLPDSELLPLFAAIERVRVAIEPNWAQTFAQHLSGSDGLALLMDVAHDLRSPLTSILVLAETLQRGQSGPVNEIQRRQLGSASWSSTAWVRPSLVPPRPIRELRDLTRYRKAQIDERTREAQRLDKVRQDAGVKLSSVASDIIEFTQGGDQLVEQEPVGFSVTAMLESVRDIVRPIAEEKHLTVRLLAPAVDERKGHPVALSRMLLNLTTNALKFTEEGYVEIVAREIAPTRIEFAVRDSGKGMSPEKINTLFQPLRKESGRRGQLFSQTGLGLTICRKLAIAMKSELKVESRIGWGTSFFFEVELMPVPPRRSGPRATPRTSGATRASGPRPRP